MTHGGNRPKLHNMLMIFECNKYEEDKRYIFPVLRKNELFP